MEVSGRKENFQGSCSGSGSSSSERSELFCQPCSGDGQHMAAEGYCQNCKEYLCVTCITYHRKVTLSKHHVILDKHRMPTNKQQSAAKPICTEVCDKHGAEFVKFFCKRHEAVGCGDCMILGHKSCKIDYIPDIAEKFINGKAVTSLVEKIERLMSVVEETKVKVAKDEKDAASAYLEAVNDVRQFRKDADAYLDKVEQELLAQCDQMRKDNTDMIQSITDHCETAENQLDEIHAQLTSAEEQSTSMFVKTKKNMPLVKKIEQKLPSADDRFSIQVCRFKRNLVLSDIISKCSPLGEIETSNICQYQSKTRINSAVPKQEWVNDTKLLSDGPNCVTSGVAVAKKTQALTYRPRSKQTDEQLALHYLIHSRDTHKDAELYNKIKQIIELTGCSQDKAEIALYDCNNDIDKAIAQVLEGEVDQQTDEQLALHYLIHSRDTHKDAELYNKIKQIIELTGCSQDKAEIALYDCNNDIDKAIAQVLEGEVDQSEWRETGKKKKKPLFHVF